MSNNFRLSNKKIYNDKRSTIENIHNEKMDAIDEQYKTINKKKKKLENLQYIYSTIIDYNQKYDIQNKIDILKKEIYNIENNTELCDYLFKAIPFILNIDEENTTKTNEENTTKTNEENTTKTNEETNEENEEKNEENEEKNEKNIKETKNKDNILNYVNKIGSSNKGKEYNQYINECFDLGYNEIRIDINNCKNCNCDNFEYDCKEGNRVCLNCGLCEYYSKNDSDNINFSDLCNIEYVTQTFCYQRQNHFKEWLIQLQGKEVTVIPDSVIDLIVLEIKKERINNINEIDYTKIKRYLKKLKLTKYYEHIPNIINCITKKPPLIISAEFQDILLELFEKIQKPFEKHRPKNRKNFLSYSYTLYKFCQLLKKQEYLIYFPLLKSREKLFEQEKIWKNICDELNWKFISSI